jgi:transcriptional regulator with XRE-family HTH domain
MFLMVNKQDFGYWVQEQRNQHGWSQSDLARLSGLNRAVINKIESGASRPTPETLIALAEPLGFSPVVIFRKAGLLPPGLTDDDAIEDWKELLGHLSKRDQAILKQTARSMLESDKKGK